MKFVKNREVFMLIVMCGDVYVLKSKRNPHFPYVYGRLNELIKWGYKPKN